MTVKLAFAAGSRGGTNTWHLRSTNVPVGGATPPLSEVVRTFYDSMKTQFPSSMSFHWDGELTEVGVTDPPALGGMPGWSVGGTGGTQYGPAGVGFVVSWRSGTASRSGRGRTFLSPVVPAVVLGDGTLNDEALPIFRSAASDLVAASVSDGNGAITVWSPTEKIGRDVLSYSINDKVAWLRTRRG